MSTGEPGGYRFGPLERRGVLAGWRGGQVAVVAAALTVGVAVLRLGSPAGPVGAAGSVLAGLAVACWPIRGHTTEEWAPTVAAWAVRWILRRRSHRSGAPTLGRAAVVRAPCRLGPDGRWGGPRPSGRQVPSQVPTGGGASPPGPLAGCRLLAPLVTPGAPRLGVVHDRHARTYTAAVAVSSPPFALLGAEEQRRRVDAWSALLAGLAREGSAVHRLQWVARTTPGGLAGGAADGLAVAPEGAAARSYVEVAARTNDRARHHGVMIVLSLRANGNRGPAADEGACAVLARELGSLQASLAAAGVAVLGPLGPPALAAALRQPVEATPGGPAPPRLGITGHLGSGDPGRTAWPWPLATEATWAAYRTDATWHASYWVAEWPRVDVHPGFLSPLLVEGDLRLAMALTMQPISPLRAVRDVRRARTADVADAELRRRGGFLTSARRQREAELVARREVELADGHAEYRFSGYVTVTSGSREALEADCGRLEQAAGLARLELRRLHGRQDTAFTWTLPLARGLM
ncbi:MAG TPA: SCO6880 family protein [Acidimicrobiales bacterium]|nr:SCO6880 family protein [Acidimicrobiales bacterium]